ncbi:MAG: GtrA family protein [Clostridia bacterium]|nr:GtrA family protein [Clostridia bacterium]
MSNKKESPLGEVVKFLIAGGVCFGIKLVCSVALKFGFGHDTWLSVLLAELVAIAANYILSVLWIWPGTGENGPLTKIGFLVTSLIGLAWNELLMLLLGRLLGEEQVLFTLLGKDITMYMLNVCITTVIVMFWNFFTKRAVLKSNLLNRWARKWERK